VPAGLPRYKPPAVEVDFSGPVRLRLHPARLALAEADRAGREYVREQLEKARQDFLAGELWAEVLRLRSRLTEVDTKKAEVRLTLEDAKEKHRKAAADGGDPAKLYRKVLDLRNEWNGHAAASAAVAGQLKAAEAKALEDLARRVGEARRAAAEDVAGRKRRLHEELLAALKPLLESLYREAAAAAELAQLARTPPRLPAV
jgi:hypothetical protein